MKAAEAVHSRHQELAEDRPPPEWDRKGRAAPGATPCPPTLSSTESWEWWGFGAKRYPGGKIGVRLTSVALAGGVVPVQLAQQRADAAQDVRLHLCGDKEDVSGQASSPGTPAVRDGASQHTG